jgi:hypothetical protein
MLSPYAEAMKAKEEVAERQIALTSSREELQIAQQKVCT